MGEGIKDISNCNYATEDRDLFALQSIGLAVEFLELSLERRSGPRNRRRIDEFVAEP